MPHDVEESVLVNVAPADVWRWTVEDVELERSWRNLDGSGVQTLERLDEGPVQVGSRFRGTVKIGPGRPQGYLNEVTELEEGRRIAWRTVEADGPLLGSGAYELTPEGGRTRFKVDLDYPPRTWIGRLQRPIVRAVASRFVRRAVSKLKEGVESEASSAGSASTA